MRIRFDKQLDILHEEMLKMGQLCEEAITDCSEAILQGDIKIAATLSVLTGHITNQERLIENICIKMLMQQQPVAGDLRTISAALKMVTDMQRIGDQSGGIAEIIQVGNIKPETNTEYLKPMTHQVVTMVKASVDAFVSKDLQLAREVIEMDDAVDMSFSENKLVLLSDLKADTPEYTDEAAVDLLMIDKYLERIADHAVNIAKWVIFSITGDIVDKNLQ